MKRVGNLEQAVEWLAFERRQMRVVMIPGANAAFRDDHHNKIAEQHPKIVDRKVHCEVECGQGEDDEDRESVGSMSKHA